MLNKFYQKLQVIMTMLGLYDGDCDGVWGPKCIEAKRKWELMDEFEPATPSNGLPFNGRGKLPKGMNWGYKGLDLIWDQWDQAKADEILKEKGKLLTHELVAAHVLGTQTKVEEKKPEPVATVNTVEQKPLAASVLSTVPEKQAVPVPEEETEEVDEEVVEQPQQSQPQQKTQNPNWTKHRK